MEELSQLGLKKKNILVKFLKENKIYGCFLANTLNVRNKTTIYRSINNIFNVDKLGDINFDDFFPVYCALHPSKLNVFERFTYWANWKGKWVEFIWRQEYKKYDI